MDYLDLPGFKMLLDFGFEESNSNDICLNFVIKDKSLVGYIRFNLFYKTYGVWCDYGRLPNLYNCNIPVEWETIIHQCLIDLEFI